MLKYLKFIKTLPLIYFFILPIFLGFFALPLFHRGMFVDGLLYGIISRNWAEGIGDMWHLYDSNLRIFEDHPPLFFVMEGLLFKIFGDHFWIEGLFMFLVIGGILLLFVRISQIIHQTILKDIADSLLKFTRFIVPYWIFIFLAMNEVAHTFNNNLLDTLLTLLTLWSVYFSFRAFQIPHRAFLYYIFSALTILLAYLTKGPLGLYPLVLPTLLFLFFRPHRKWQGLWWSLYIFMVFLVAIGLLLLINPQAATALKRYHEVQVFSALKTNISTELVAQAQGRRMVNAYYWSERPLVWFKVIFVNILGSLFCFAALLLAYVKFIGQKNPFKNNIFRVRLYRRFLIFLAVLSLIIAIPLMYMM